MRAHLFNETGNLPKDVASDSLTRPILRPDIFWNCVGAFSAINNYSDFSSRCGVTSNIRLGSKSEIKQFYCKVIQIRYSFDWNSIQLLASSSTIPVSSLISFSHFFPLFYFYDIGYTYIYTLLSRNENWLTSLCHSPSQSKDPNENQIEKDG